MTDDHTPDQPAPEQGGSLPVDSAEEEDVDSLLENASMLAAELSEEVGESARVDGAQPQAEELSSTGDVDRTLDDMGHLLDNVGDELGSAADSEGEAEGDSQFDVDQALQAAAADLEGQPVAESETPISAMDSARDDFEATGDQGAESSDLPPEVESDTVENNAISDQGSPFGDLDMDSTGGDIPSLDDADDGGDTSLAASAGETTDGKPAEDQDGMSENDTPHEQSKLSAIALAGCSRGAGILELADRPFAWVSQPIRRLVGLVALGTLATAVIVFLVSLF